MGSSCNNTINTSVVIPLDCAPQHHFCMPQRTVRFIIRPDGRVVERVEGVAGDACQQLTENVEAALGTVEHQESTSEAFLQPEIQSLSLPAQLN